MGTNASKSVSKINQEISNKISQESTASATADCGIKTGNIILKNAKNCSIRNKNFCNTTAASAIDTTVEAAARAFNDASKEQKAAMLPGINVNSTTQEINTAIKNELEQKCGAKSDLRNNILTNDIIFDGCENSTIDNINLGDAAGTCGIRAIMQSAVDAQNVEKEKQETTGLNLFGGVGMWISMILGVIVLGVIIFVVVKYFITGSSPPTLPLMISSPVATKLPTSGSPLPRGEIEPRSFMRQRWHR